MTYRVNLTRPAPPAPEDDDYACQVCGAGLFDDACRHYWCDVHGWTEVDVANSGSGPGFTGASIYWTTLRCGCQDFDGSADNLDAVR